MVYCKAFIDGIHSINFQQQSAETLRNALLAYAYQDLLAELKRAQEENSQLSQQPILHPLVEPSVSKYKEALQRRCETIETQIQALLQMARDHGFDIEQTVALDDFIPAFASYFRNIRHLADTLSDAPAMIKIQQTRMFTEVLFKLDAEEQELQLRTLSLSHLTDMIQQAMAVYEHAMDTSLLHQSQKLVYMGLYEIIRRECDQLNQLSSLDDKTYQAMLHGLRQKLPDVGSLTIIDTLSDYKSSNGLTIQDLFKSVEDKFNVSPVSDWQNAEKIESLVEKKSLFHQLRFGQDDRREYVKKTKDNLARDLFWARNIRDIELFIKSRVSDEVFLGISQQAALSQCPTLEQSLDDLQGLSVAEKRLFSAMDDVKEFCRENKANRFGKYPKDKALIAAQFKQALLDRFKQPTIKIEDHVIVLEFYFSTIEADEFIDRIFMNGGFGRNLDDLIIEIRNEYDNHQIPRLNGVKLSGRSFDEIAQQIDKIEGSNAERDAYKSQLKQVMSQATAFMQAPNISALQLGNSEEVLLRKLLELHYISPISGVTDHPAILEAFQKMAKGAFLEALKVTRLESAVQEAYLQLATLDESTVSASLRPIIQKSKILKTSRDERHTTLQKLDDVFSSEDAPAKKIEQIHQLFMEEYTSMSATLGSHDVDRLSKDVHAMATEMVRLVDRTKNGEPALTEREQSAYFSIVNQIAKAIAPTSVEDVHFKIKHSLKGLQRINILDAKGQAREIEIDIGPLSLPYSLVKPLGHEFIFSYGGTRGIVAPFEGLDEAYAGEGKQKGRLFTHSRLLGVGQYGSVKEVESLLTGLNQVIKKGYVPPEDNTPTFRDANRNDLRTRPITARDDTLYRIENDVLQSLSQARHASGDSSIGHTRYWIEQDKERPAGRLFSKEGAPQQYQILTDRAKGDTYADTANKQLNKYTKGDIAYHDPLKRDSSLSLGDLKDRLSLAQVCTTEAQRFARLGFAHNDIKPENFLYRQNTDGTFDVRYIDWATGGFEQLYQGSFTDLRTIFTDVFGHDLETEIQDNQCVDRQGRFVKIEGNQIYFGINPTLQILHGARNGTLPYISPKVLGEHRTLKALPGGETDAHLDTTFSSSDATMDNWALTAMAFGVCNRQAYFALVKGRVVSDYVVPGILEMDGERPLGLKIVDANKFNDYFACGSDRVRDADLTSGDVYRETQAVMYIPSTQREGEPLHLYRRLQAFQAELKAKAQAPDSPEQHVSDVIQTILDRVHHAVASGEGFTKEALQDLLAQTQQCIRNYEALNDANYQDKLLKADVFKSLIQQNQQKALTADELLEKMPTIRRMTVLCTYPTTPSQELAAIAILEHVLNEAQLNDKCLSPNAPCQDLFKACIATNQQAILNTLLNKITSPNAAFIEQVKADGLLHYAAQQGMTDSFVALANALRRAGASNYQIFEWMMQEYGPQDLHIHGVNHIQWATNSFHAAIRNDNATQLSAILDVLPAGHAADDVIKKALHFSATLGLQERFQQILSKYNALNPNHPFTVKELLTIQFSPDETSPYHLFLRDEATLDLLDWSALKQDAALVKSFLLNPPEGSVVFPTLIAAKGGNFKGVARLFDLGKGILTHEEWTQLLTQTDEEGKNILNHVLEHGQLSALPDLLNIIKEQCLAPEETLIQWLGNPNPVNPIKNFLTTEKNEALQFATIKQLLDALCERFESASLEQQMARVVALIVNQDWLIQQAEAPDHHQALFSLLHNEALPLPLKRLLFNQLSQNAQDGSVAKQFYHRLLDDISLQQSPELLQVPLEISTTIFQNVAKQKNDVSDLVAALTAGYQAIDVLSRGNKGLTSKVEELTLTTDALSQHLQELTKQKQAGDEAQRDLATQLSSIQAVNSSLTEKNRALDARVTELNQTAASLSVKVREEEANVLHVSSELASTREQLQSALKQVDSLKQEEERLQRAHQEKVTEIESLRTSDRQASEALLAAEKGQHADEMAKLHTQFELSIAETARLTEALSAQDLRFVASQSQVEELGRSLASLMATKESLELELATTKDTFAAQLDQSRKDIESASASLLELEERMGLVQAERAALDTKVSELQQTNAALLEKNGKLVAQVEALTATSASLSMQLKAESASVRQMEEELGGTREQLQSALAEADALKKEEAQLAVVHQEKVAELERLMVVNGEKSQQMLDAEKSQHSQEMAALSLRLDAELIKVSKAEEQLNAIRVAHEAALATIESLSKKGESSSQALELEKANVRRMEEQMGVSDEALQQALSDVASLKQSSAQAQVAHEEKVAELQRLSALEQQAAQQEFATEKVTHASDMAALHARLETSLAETARLTEALSAQDLRFAASQSRVEELGQSLASLMATKESLEGELATTKGTFAAQLDRSQKDMASASASLLELEKRIGLVQTERAALDTKVSELQQTNAALLEKNGQLAAQVEVLTATSASLSTQLKAETASVRHMEEELGGTREQLQSALAEADALKKEEAQLTVAHQEKVAELERLMVVAGEKSQQMLEAEKSQHSQEMSALSLKLDAEIAQVSKIEEQLSVVKEAHASDMAALHARLETSLAETARLTEALSAQDQRFAASQSRVEELGQSLASLMATKESLERELATTKDTFAAQLDRSQKDMASASASLLELEKRIGLVQTERAALDTKVTELQQTNAALLEKNGQLAAQVEALTATSASLSTQLKAETASVRHMEEELGGTREQLQSALAEADALKKEEAQLAVVHQEKVAELERLMVVNGEKSQQMLDAEKSQHSQEMAALSLRLDAELIKVSKAEKQLSAIRVAHEAALATIESLSKKGESSSQALEHAKANVERLEEQLGDSGKALQQALSDVASLKQSSAQAQVAHEEKVAELQRLSALEQQAAQQEFATEKVTHASDMAALHARLETSLAETARLTEALAIQDQRFAASQSRVEELDQSLASLTATKESLERELATTKDTFVAQLDQSRKDIASASASLLELEERMGFVQAERAALGAEVSELQQTNATLLENNGKLVAQVEALTATSASLSTQLEAKIESVLHMEGQLSSTHEQLQLALAQAESLEVEKERLQIAHQATLAEIKQQMASDHDASERLLTDERAHHAQEMAVSSDLLDIEKAAHANDVAAIQAQLEASLAEAAQLKQTLASQAKLFSASQAQVDDLTKTLTTVTSTKEELEVRLAATEKAKLESQQASDAEVLKLQQANAGLLEKNSVLSSQLEALNASSLGISQQLKEETEQLALTRKQLKSVSSQVISLQHNIEEAEATHKEKMAEIEGLLDLSRAEFQHTLEDEQSRHLQEMRALQDQLASSIKQAHDFEERLATQASSLTASQSKLASVESDLAIHIEQNQQLRAELSRAGVESADLQKGYEARLAQSQALLESTQRALVDAQSSLEHTQIEKARLAEQVAELQERNATLSCDADVLLHEKEEAQRSLAQKQLELERLQETLRQVAEEKAVLEICNVIHTLTDLAILKPLANAQDHAALQGLALARPILEALYFPNAFLKIKETALQRLGELENNALVNLKDMVSKSTSRAQITAIANARSNADLQTAGLDAVQVAALSLDNAYESIATVAAARLQLHTDTMANLRRLIDEARDVNQLHAMAGAKNNRALLAIANWPLEGNALIDENAYQTITTLALEKINQMNPNVPRAARLIAQDRAIEALKKIIATTKDRELLVGLRRAQHNDDLYLDDLELKWVDALVEDQAYVPIVTAAETRLEQLNIARERKHARYLDPDRYEAALAEDHELLDKMQKHVDVIHHVDNKIRNQLKKLGGLHSFYWFNPGFQAAAKKNADEMIAHFERLSEECNVLLGYLKPLRWELKEQLDSIPTRAAMTHLESLHIKRMEERVKLLTRYIESIEKDLALYKPVDKLLHGDFRSPHPLLKQGLLKTIRQAQAEKGDIKLHSFNSSTEDFPMATLADHVKRDYVSRPTVNHATTLTKRVSGDSYLYDVVAREKTGEFREYTIDGDQPTAGRFIELHATSYRENSLDDSDIRRNVPDVKIIINSFPAPPPGTDPTLPESPQLIEARIKFSLAAASQLIAGLGQTPTEKTPLVCVGSDLVEQQYLWTALMILGKSLPHMRFDEKAIRVISCTFFPEAEMGKMFGFSKTSCYETRYKPNMALVKNLIGGMKEVDENKFGYQHSRQEMKKSVIKVNSIFGSKLETTCKELKEELDRGMVLDR